MPLCAPPFVPGRRDPSPAALSNTGHLHLPFGMAKILLHSTPAPRKEREQLSSLSSILFFFLAQRPAGPRAASGPQLWVPRGCRRGPLASPLGDIPPALPQTLQDPEESFLKIALSSWPGPCPAFPGWDGGSSLCFCRGTDKSSGGIPPLLPSKPH